LGEPRINTSQAVKNAYIKAIQDGNNRYGSVQGLEELRYLVSEKLKKENLIDSRAEEILITSGATEAIGFSILSLLNKGDEVILFEPNYPIFSPLIKYVNSCPKIVQLKEENLFQPDLEELKNAISKKTKLLIINSPHDPTGAVFSKNIIKAITEIFKQTIISDEVYEKIIFQEKHHSVTSLAPNPERVITANSFSKSYSMCGYRVCYLHGPISLIKQLLKLKLYISTRTNVPSHKAAIAALGDLKYPNKLKSELNERKKIVIRSFKKMRYLSLKQKEHSTFFQMYLGGVEGINFIKLCYNMDY
jgi:aspartate aminotransferase